MIRTLVPLLVCLATTAGAQTKPRVGDLPPGLRSLAGVELNRDSALSIRAKLGPGAMHRIGSGHDQYITWCYRGRNEGRAFTLQLMSDAGDMGTSGHALNVIVLRAPPSAVDARRCPLLVRPIAVSTPAGLRLGLDRADVARLLGPPTLRTTDSLHYEFESKEYMKPGSAEYVAWNTPQRRKDCFGGGEPYVDVLASATLIFRGGRVVSLRLERYDQSTC